MTSLELKYVALAGFATAGLLAAAVPTALATPDTVVQVEQVETVTEDSEPKLDGLVAGPDVQPYERDRKKGDIVGTPPEELPEPEGLAMHELYLQPEGLSMAEPSDPLGVSIAEPVNTTAATTSAASGTVSPVVPWVAVGGLTAATIALAQPNSQDEVVLPFSP